MSLVEVENFIGGQFIGCESHLDSYDPSTGEVWARIPDSSSGDVDAAVKAAKNAFPKYASLRSNRANITHLRTLDGHARRPKNDREY